MPYSNYYAGGNGIPYMQGMGGLGQSPSFAEGLGAPDAQQGAIKRSRRFKSAPSFVLRSNADAQAMASARRCTVWATVWEVSTATRTAWWRATRTCTAAM